MRRGRVGWTAQDLELWQCFVLRRGLAKRFPGSADRSLKPIRAQSLAQLNKIDVKPAFVCSHELSYGRLDVLYSSTKGCCVTMVQDSPVVL